LYIYYYFLREAFQQVSAQTDLDALMEEDAPSKEYIKNAFKSSRVISSHSIEFIGPGVLDFRILHRFGRLNSGSYQAFGLDEARIRLGLDYGISRRLTVGIGRSSYKKELDGFLKYRLLWQASGKNASPLSIVLVSGMTNNQMKWEDPDRENFYSSRLAFYHQVIIGRKFSQALTLQVAPTMVHNNLVQTDQDEHDIYSLGVGGRMKLTKRLALTADYYYQFSELPDVVTQPLSLGFDIETGGHVFQLHFTNALGMNERVLTTETDGHWDKGDIHFGFNISRVFTIVRKKTPEKAKEEQELNKKSEDKKW
jgi:hypothetical protein